MPTLGQFIVHTSEGFLQLVIGPHLAALHPLSELCQFFARFLYALFGARGDFLRIPFHAGRGLVNRCGGLLHVPFDEGLVSRLHRLVRFVSRIGR